MKVTYRISVAEFLKIMRNVYPLDERMNAQAKRNWQNYLRDNAQITVTVEQEYIRRLNILRTGDASKELFDM